MWEIRLVEPVKLIVGVMAADRRCLEAAVAAVREQYGDADFVSPEWDFSRTTYYEDEMGGAVLRQFVSFETLIWPDELAGIKRRTNDIEAELAEQLGTEWPRPVNLDPGYMEPSKLVLASTKNFSHRIYIGQNIWAEVTMTYAHGQWQTYPFTFPDYKSGRYNVFFDQVRQRIVEQWKQWRKGNKQQETES